MQILFAHLFIFLVKSKKGYTENFIPQTYLFEVTLDNYQNVFLYYQYLCPLDDSILIWDAVIGYVNEYVNIYYKNEEGVVKEYELQEWAKNLAKTGVNGGNIKDMPSQI